ncbi:Non-specific serine/threonine protein kinase [Ascochyta lentis]
MGSDDIVDFEVIENSKENIQAIPSGRSARALAQLYTPPLGAKPGHAPSPLQSQDAHSATRLEFEKELMNIDDSDDPLDIYDRYVKWTMDAYPSAQNDKQSQLCPLLERATKAFQSSTHYKNDPRYLKLWLHYIRLFSDTPQEVFRFLARHNIGDGLALYYEEFAAWLEGAGRFSQAEEIYNMGIEREARPTERLVRKYGEFQHRFENRPQDVAEPSSPALPAIRPALAAKVDPFAPASPEPQAQSQPKAAKPKSGKPKMAIFSDEGEPARTSSSGSGKGWDSIGTVADRKKENAQEARPWAGETLKAGKTNKGAGKMMIFKDETKSYLEDETSKPHPLREQLQAVNPKTGRVEVVFVDLEQVYPNHEDPMSVEFSFEELRARHRGWLDRDWAAIRREEQEQARKLAEEAAAAQLPKPKPAPLAPKQEPLALKQNAQNPSKPQTVPLKGGEDGALAGDDENRPPSQADVEKARAAKKARKEERANRTRKIQVLDVKEISGETQTIQAKLDSPSKKSKVRRKKSGREATMTLHTKEAMDDIYEIFNQPLKKPEEEEIAEPQSEEVSSDDDESDYTSGAESTATRSEFGDETTVGGDFTLGTVIGDNNSDDGSEVDNTEIDNTDAGSVSAWSDLTENKEAARGSEDEDSDSDAHSNDGSEHSADESFEEVSHPLVHAGEQHEPEVTTPTSPDAPASLPTRFVPVPPEDHDYPMRPYRDPLQAANNRLPFMTPIVEKTESSLGFATAYAQKEQLNAKTPSRSKGDLTIFEDEDDGEPGSSPYQDLLGQAIDGPGKITKLSLREPKPFMSEPIEEPQRKPLAAKPAVFRDPKPAGPIIKDTQCNPVDEAIRNTILQEIQPPLDSYDGYFADTEAVSGKGLEIRKYTKAVSKMKNNAQDKTITNLAAPPKLKFEGSDRTYTVKRELGKGAFAPVYLIEGSLKEEQDENAPVQMGKGEFGLKRQPLEALKMEDPPTPWEFYIMRQAKRRLGVSRASDSIVHAYEMHVFRDECYLVEEFRDQGTLLDLVNIARAENGVMDEQLAMFFTIELFRTVEALHAKGIIHGDLKADNILVRFDALQKGEWDSVYQRDGRDGWASKGISLIDFGRGIDMKAFKPDVQFIADWPTTEADCAEMRELRPWTYQIDYHGLAGIVHNLLFGKYISTVAERGATLGAGATKTYKIKESLKRYWQTEIWHECLDLLLNPLMHMEGEEGKRLPVLKGMREVREKMEAHLESNCEKGIGLKALVRKMEEAVKKR